MIADTRPDEEKLAAIAATLADAVETAVPTWVQRSVERLVVAHQGMVTGAVREAAADAGRRCAAEVGADLRAQLARDVDEQRANPLAMLRAAVAYPTAVLRDADVPPVERSDFDERAFPDDVYGLAPATWSDIDPELQEPGLVWGAAKAHVVLARRAAEGNKEGHKEEP